MIFIIKIISKIDEELLNSNKYDLKRSNNKFSYCYTLNCKDLNKQLLNNQTFKNYYDEQYPLLKFGEQTHVVNSIDIYNTDKEQKIWYSKIELNPNCIVSELRNEQTIKDNKTLKQCFNELKNYFLEELGLDIDYEKSKVIRLDLNLDIKNILETKKTLSLMINDDYNVLYYYKPILHRLIKEISFTSKEYKVNNHKNDKYKIQGINNISINNCDLTIYDKGLQIMYESYGILDKDCIRFEVRFDTEQKITKHLRINSVLDLDLKALDVKKRQFLYNYFIKDYLKRLIEETKDLQLDLYKALTSGERYFFSNWLKANKKKIVAKKQVRHILNSFVNLTDVRKREYMKSVNVELDNLGIDYSFTEEDQQVEREQNKTKYNNNLRIFNQLVKEFGAEAEQTVKDATKGEHFNLELFLKKIELPNQ